MRTAASGTLNTRTFRLVALALLTALMMAMLPTGAGVEGAARMPGGCR